MPFLIPLFLFGLPHVFLMETYQIFSVNKFLWILIFSSIFLLVLAKEFFTQKKIVMLPSPHFWSLAVVFILGCLSSAWFSNIPIESFFGGATRHFGVLFIGILFFWFTFLLSQNFSDTEWKKWVFIPLVCTGGIMSIWAILQGFNIYPIFSNLNLEALSYRSFSGMGQPNFLAQALLIPLLISLWFAVFAKTKIIKICMITVFLLGVWAMWKTGSRAGFIALTLGSMAFGGLWITLQTQMKSWAIITITGIFGIIGFLWGSIFFFGNDISLFLGERGASIEARYFFWNESLALLQQHWMFGVGADMLQHYLGSALSPAAFAAENFSTIPDRVHTFWIDFWLQYGIISFVLLLFALGATLWRGVKNITNGDLLSVLALAGIVATFTAWTFGFAILTDSIFIVICFALVWRASVVEISFPRYFCWTKALGTMMCSVGLMVLSWKIFISEVSLFQLSQGEITHPHAQQQTLDHILEAPFLSQNMIQSYSLFPYSESREQLVFQLLEISNSHSFNLNQILLADFALRGEKEPAKKAFHDGWNQIKNHPVFAWNFLRNGYTYRIISEDEFMQYKQEIQQNIPSIFFERKMHGTVKFQKFWKHHEQFITELFDGKNTKDLVR